MKFYSHSHSVFKYMVLKSFVEVVLTEINPEPEDILEVCYELVQVYSPHWPA